MAGLHILHGEPLDRQLRGENELLKSVCADLMREVAFAQMHSGRLLLRRVRERLNEARIEVKA